MTADGRAISDRVTFSRSILASVAIRVSRIRLTIHFSPSSGERLRRAERSLSCEKSVSLSAQPSHCEGRGNVRDVNSLMDATVRLADEVPSIVQEIVLELAQEEVIPDDTLRELQLPLCGLKVKLDVEFLKELCDRVRVLILFELHDLDDLPYRMPYARADRGGTCGARRLRLAREHGGDGDVAQDPGCCGLNGVEVGGGEERLEEEGAACGVVEVDEEGPVHEPGARMERREGLRM